MNGRDPRFELAAVKPLAARLLTGIVPYIFVPFERLSSTSDQSIATCQRLPREFVWILLGVRVEVGLGAGRFRHLAVHFRRRFGHLLRDRH